jgi:hypothetical protein
MKETLMVTDEAYRSDMERLWRYIRRLRDTTEYTGVKFTVQNWMLACDGNNEKSGVAAGIDITDMVFRLQLQPTNSDLIAALKAGGADTDTDLPALLTFTIDVEYTKLA